MTETLDPIAEVQRDVKRILLHMVGGIGPDGQRIIGQGEMQRDIDKRLITVEEFIASAKRCVLGTVASVITLIISAWAMLGAGPKLPPGHP